MKHSKIIKQMLADYILIQAETALSIGMIGSKKTIKYRVL